MLFQAMEKDARQHFRMGRTSVMGEDCKATVCEKHEYEDVALY